MPEGLEDAAIAFGNELTPQVQPRDQRGKFIPETTKPEPMFALRPIEGDPLTGDTRDGGDNERFRAREREVADGRVREREDGEDGSRSSRAPAEDERSGRQRREPDAAQRNDAAADEGHSGTDVEQEDIWSILSEGDGVPRANELTQTEGEQQLPEGDSERDAETEKYEVTVDGEVHHVSLEEALRGYTRETTFHKRMGQVAQSQAAVDNEVQRLHQGWAAWHKARQDYEEDLVNITPAEPNWDQAFAVNPAEAHAQQKIFQIIYGKLAQSRNARAQRETEQAAERDRQVQDYAVKGFTRFVMDNKIPDEPTLKKQLQSMRRTAAAVGFSEYEVATVYDPRMLTILLKASKYDRMQAAKPRAVIAGKGRTLLPGAATPLGGNGQRKGLDEALRRQASSGSLDDTAQVFRRLL